MSNRKIAVCCGIGRSAVAEYLCRAADAGLVWPLPAELSDAAIAQRLFPPPPTRANRDRTPRLVGSDHYNTYNTLILNISIWNISQNPCLKGQFSLKNIAPRMSVLGTVQITAIISSE
jgi:hypothetical protein